jgi:hypothetical protein
MKQAAMRPSTAPPRRPRSRPGAPNDQAAAAAPPSELALAIAPRARRRQWRTPLAEPAQRVALRPIPRARRRPCFCPRLTIGVCSARFFSPRVRDDPRSLH